MNLSPYLIEAAFDAEDCARIIALAEAEGLERAGLVRGVQDSDLRRANIAWLDDAKEAEWVFDRVLRTMLLTISRPFSFW